MYHIRVCKPLLKIVNGRPFTQPSLPQGVWLQLQPHGRQPSALTSVAFSARRKMESAFRRVSPGGQAGKNGNEYSRFEC